MYINIKYTAGSTVFSVIKEQTQLKHLPEVTTVWKYTVRKAFPPRKMIKNAAFETLKKEKSFTRTQNAAVPVRVLVLVSVPD